MSRHGAVEIKLAGKTRSFRLGLGEIEELERLLDISVFLISGAMSTELPFLKVEQWKHIIRLGFIGGAMPAGEAVDATEALFDDLGSTECSAVALTILMAALGRVHSDSLSPSSGEAQTPKSNGSTSAPSTAEPS